MQENARQAVSLIDNASIMVDGIQSSSGASMSAPAGAQDREKRIQDFKCISWVRLGASP
jgi:hypothetical protein